MPMLPLLQHNLVTFKEELEKENMKLIPLFFTDGFLCPANHGFAHHRKPGRSVDDHFGVFKSQAEELIKSGITERVDYINCHTGCDYMTRAESIELLTRITDYAREEGLNVGHETHRSRCLYSPWVVRDMLSSLPKDIKFTADLSHWIVVSERPPQDEDIVSVVKMIAPHVAHIHARVGHEQASQVNDPRCPTWTGLVAGYCHLWQLIMDVHITNGGNVTVLPEHGPFPYQPTHPFADNKPVADIWEINNHMGEVVVNLFRERRDLLSKA
jgi:sugar phosphate isomerase/epimerase